MKRQFFIFVFAALTTLTAAERAYQPISKAEMARRTLEEEEIEFSIAEDRAAAKFSVTYHSDIDDLIKPRASRVHDRVTFVIDENTAAKVEAKNDLKSDNSMLVNLQNWFKLGTNKNGDFQVKPYSMKNDDGSLTTNNSNDAQINWTNSSQHKAEGKTNRTSTLKSKLSGEVIEVLPNGHLVVEAKKSVLINGETQDVLLVGTVDPNDLNDKSEVDGDRVIALRLAYKGKGEVTDTVRQGWMSKIVTKFKPF